MPYLQQQLFVALPLLGQSSTPLTRATRSNTERVRSTIIRCHNPVAKVVALLKLCQISQVRVCMAARVDGGSDIDP